MPLEPPIKRTATFFDGQNLFHSARESFGYTYPNYDVLALSTTICGRMGWELTQSRFYTGIPDPWDDPFWNHFWSAKLRSPFSPTSVNRRGIDKMDWIRIDRATYDACIDPRDYRPKGRFPRSTGSTTNGSGSC